MTTQRTPPDILANLLDNTTASGVVDVPLDLIGDNPFQERTDYGELTDLANDIREHGVMSPPIARRVAGGHYELAFGHRRRRACELANLPTMPLLVRALTDEQMATMAYSENEQRADVSPIDKASSIQAMITRFGWTHQQIADKLNISRPAVSNLLRLLRLPDHLQDALGQGQISARQAEALLAVVELPDEIKQRAESNWDASVRPSAIISDALKGASSDHIRDRMLLTVQRFSQRVDDQPFYPETFTHPDAAAQRCDACPHAIKRDAGVYCPKSACWYLKDDIMLQHWLSLAAAVAGVPVDEEHPRLNSSYHEDFRFSPYREILTTEPLCPNLRVVELSADQRKHTFPGAIDGHPHAAIVCHKAGNHQCSCIAKRQRTLQKVNPTKTSMTVAKAIVEDAAQVLARAIEASFIDPDLVRLIIGSVTLAPNFDDIKDQTYHVRKTEPVGNDQVIIHAARLAFQRHVKEWSSPTDNRHICSQLLALAGLPSPWEQES